MAALGGSALYEVTYGALGSVLGQPQMLHVALARIVVVVSVTNAVLAIPAMRLVKWGMAAGLDRGDADLRRRRGRRPMTPPGAGPRVPLGRRAWDTGAP